MSEDQQQPTQPEPAPVQSPQTYPMPLREGYQPLERKGYQPTVSTERTPPPQSASGIFPVPSSPQSSPPAPSQPAQVQTETAGSPQQTS